MLYRACLGVLREKGLAIEPGEDAGAFAARARQQAECPAFVRFTDKIASLTYAGRQPAAADVKEGMNAYLELIDTLTLREKLKYAVSRFLHGAGDAGNIP